MNNSLINIIIFVVSFLALTHFGSTVGQECPASRGKLSDLKKLWQDFENITEIVCKKTNNLVPKTFVTETANCFDKHIKPCLKTKAPIIIKAMKECLEDKLLTGDNKFCDQQRQDEVVVCGLKWFEMKKEKLMKAFTPNMGLIREKGKLFKKCIKDNMKTLKASQ